MKDAAFLVECPPFKNLSYEMFASGFVREQEFLEVVEELTEQDHVKWAAEPNFEEKTGIAQSPILHTGYIKALPSNENFGFIRDSRGDDWFFHQNHMLEQKQWTSLKEGAPVAFKIGSNKTGKCAVDVHMIDRKPM